MSEQTATARLITPNNPVICPMCRKRTKDGLTIVFDLYAEYFKGCESCFDRELGINNLARVFWQLLETQREQFNEMMNDKASCDD